MPEHASPDSQIVGEGRIKLDGWTVATRRVEELKRQLNSAECDLKNCSNALGKFFTPDDCKEGEEFNLWVFGGLLGLRVLRVNGTHRDVKVYWRIKPKDF